MNTLVAIRNLHKVYFRGSERIDVLQDGAWQPLAVAPGGISSVDDASSMIAGPTIRDPMPSWPRS